MIEMHAICKVFRTGLVETHALRPFDLRIGASEFVAVTGPSGSGKTTFLNLSGLLEAFSAGSYRLDGEEVSSLNDNARARIRNEKLGFVFQSFNLIPDLDVYDNVEAPLHYRGMPARERRRRVAQSLELVGLASRARHLPAQLSGGQQQRAAIARALAGEPRILLADEPTGNLDSVMSRQVMDLLEAINASGTTIVMVTHNPELALRAHRRVCITDGEVVELHRSPVSSPAASEA
jgi:putative ABC transport system ATP-binding protein